MSEEKNTIDKIIINLGSTPIKAEKVNEIVQDLVNRGYKKENIHIVKEENNNIKKVPNSFMVGLNIEDDKEQNYNMLIDTSLSEAKDISEAISVCKKSEEDGIPYGKMWTTPKKLLPLQGIRDTCGSGLYMTFEEMLDSISKFGYLPEAPILIVEYQGKKYIIEGHHRNFASAQLGKSLVPYEVRASDKSDDPKKRERAKNVTSGLNAKYLYDHEAFFDKDGKTFSYNEVYPGIYDELAKEELNYNNDER